MLNYYGVKNAARMAFYNKSTGALAAYFPFGNAMSIEITGDKVEALAQGTTAITWQSGRKGTAKIDTDVISNKLMTIILGAANTTVANGNMVQFESKIAGTSSPTVTLSATPSTGTLSVFLTEADGATVISELTAVASAPTAVQYSVSGTTITLHTDNAGKPILLIYAKDGSNIEQMEIKANQFASAYKIVAIGVVKDINGIEKFQEITLPNATAQSNASFTYSATDKSSFSFTFDLAADPLTQNLVVFKSL